VKSSGLMLSRGWFIALLRYWLRSLLVAVLLVRAEEGLTADGQQSSNGCLYAVMVGPEATPVVPCVDVDPLNLANDPDILKVMRAFGIEPDKVHFKGCKKLRFSAAPDGMAKEGDHQYLVTYPIEAAQSYVAPITHELAHVLQMEMAGGLVPLRDAFGSKRVELGADFLTGIVFSNFLQYINVNQFQHNLELMGLYVEFEEKAHGTPEQRAQAFRYGVYFNFDNVKRDISMASDHFQSNIYGQIINF
jgi:hypothetical protein